MSPDFELDLLGETEEGMKCLKSHFGGGEDDVVWVRLSKRELDRYGDRRRGVCFFMHMSGCLSMCVQSAVFKPC